MTTAHPHHSFYHHPYNGHLRGPQNPQQSHFNRPGHINTPHMNINYNNSPHFSNQSLNSGLYNDHHYNDSHLPQYQRPYKQYADHGYQDLNYGYQQNYDPRYTEHYRNQRIANRNIPLNNNVQKNQYLRNNAQNFQHREHAHINLKDQKGPVVRQVIYQQQPLNIPEPVRNIQYIPQLHRYMDYKQQRIKVPVQKYYTDYYQIQHITDFVPREYEDTVIQMVPQQIIRYRLEYVPVQRKIVHLPKKDVYDENGLYKGVGRLADRVHTDIQINQAAVKIVNQQQKKTEGAINKALYQNLSASHVQKSAMRQLQQSLVKGISRQMQHPRGNLDQSQHISQALHSNLGKMLARNNQQNSGNYQQNAGSYQYNSRTMPSANSQLYNTSSSRNYPPPNRSRVGVSRKRTNYVTSDGYFPNYEDQVKNLESYNPPRQYFNENYAANTAQRMQGSKAGYRLGQALLGNMNASSGPADEGKNLSYNLAQSLMGSYNQPSGGYQSNYKQSPQNEFSRINQGISSMFDNMGKSGNNQQRISQADYDYY